MKKIKDIPEFDRPREKLKKKGAKSLSNLELLAAMIGSGVKGKEVFEVAKDILKLFEKDFDNVTLKDLNNVDGIGIAKSTQLISAIEFSKRFLIKEGTKIETVEDILNLGKELINKQQEYFLTLTLDGASNLIEKRIVFIGTLNQNIVHPREIFVDAISDRAAGIIFIHNHPSGIFEPSEEDKKITKKLVEVGKLIGIEVFDHIIISKNGYYSFRENGLLNLNK